MFNAQFSITHADGDVIHAELLGVTFDDIRREFGALSESFGAVNVTVEVTSYLRAEFCERCASYGEAHTAACPLHPDHDPTPWCQYCGAKQPQHCHCGPIAENN